MEILQFFKDLEIAEAIQLFMGFILTAVFILALKLYWDFFKIVRKKGFWI